MMTQHAPTVKDCSEFRSVIYSYYDSQGRILPWRETTDPYHILVSEIMLQQTQVDRVIDKYTQFVALFPDFNSLAEASVADLIAAWQGLGYNRRALNLQKSAQKTVSEFNGELPSEPDILKTFPGLGPATAASVAAFAFNKPVVFLETNIRTVFIHFFYHDKTGITDDELLPLVEKALDKENARKWYNALMDYGTMLKKKHGNLSQKSKHYTKQPPLKGSNREIRGMILKMLNGNGCVNESEVIYKINKDPERIRKNLKDLEKEGFLDRGDEGGVRLKQ